MSYELTGFGGKVAVVTGGGRMRSTGRPIAVELARAGCDVVITTSGTHPSKFPADEQAAGWGGVDAVVEEIEALGRRGLAVVADQSDLAAVQRLAETVKREFGRVDILVNNAAAARGPDRVPVVEMQADVWRHVVDVNLHGTFYCSQVFAREMVAQKHGGSIVNISSIGAKMMGPSVAAYASSKLATHALTSTMAKELGRHNIRVNALCPGVIATSRIDDIPRDSDQWRHMMTLVPLGRPGTGEEVAAAVIFLCSDQGSWITGQQWNVDGGQVTEH